MMIRRKCLIPNFYIKNHVYPLKKCETLCIDFPYAYSELATFTTNEEFNKKGRVYRKITSMNKCKIWANMNKLAHFLLTQRNLFLFYFYP